MNKKGIPVLSFIMASVTAEGFDVVLVFVQLEYSTLVSTPFSSVRVQRACVEEAGKRPMLRSTDSAGPTRGPISEMTLCMPCLILSPIIR